MGTCCAPLYANLYLGEREKDFLLGESASIYTHHICMWHRYIDDILIIWDGPKEELKDCLNLMNQNNFNLFFTMTFDLQQVNFLDVTIFKDHTGGLSSRLYRKETAGNTLLHADSFHPDPLKKSIPFSQFLQLRRNCSTNEDFQREADLLTIRLLNRGYTKSSLKKAFNRVKLTNRQDLIFRTKKQSKDDTTIRIIMRFSNEHAVRKIISKYWSILTEDPIVKGLVTSKPQITYKESGSIGNTERI